MQHQVSRSSSLWLGALLAALSLHCSEPPAAAPLPELPAIVASSKYIDYSTTGDASMLCLDDFLAREDRFIEEVASYLGVDPPTGRIRHVQSTGVEFGDPETWPCKDRAFHCYWYYEYDGSDP